MSGFFLNVRMFSSALFPKLWNSIELELILKNYLDSYASYICKKVTVFHVDKLSLCYLLHPVIHKHDSYNICYTVTLCYNPSTEYPPFPSYFFTPFLPYSWFIIIVLFKMYARDYVCSMNIHLFIYNSYSIIMGQPIKTTNSG